MVVLILIKEPMFAVADLFYLGTIYRANRSQGRMGTCRFMEPERYRSTPTHMYIQSIMLEF